MKKFEQVFLFLFTISAITNLWSEVMDWRLGVLISKPLLMTTLGLYFWSKTRKNTTYLSFFILLGLFMAIFGDCFLMFAEKSKAFFLLGLSSFLFTQLFYAIAFWRYPSKEKGVVQKSSILILPFIVFLVFNAWLLWDGLEGAMKIPVVLYSMVISAMVITALNLNGKVRSSTFRVIFTGALLFMISDFLIGLGKFGGLEEPIPQSRVLIMATYILGQYLIIKGSIQANDETP